MGSDSGNYTVGSMFAGIGGICLGFKNAGGKMVWANEIDHAACETYRLNLGEDYLVEGDIYSIDENSVPDLDILTAGFPCQAFSIAGYRKGFADERGVLFFEVMRIVKAKRPRVVFLENVKNLVGHDHGNTFKNIRECLEVEGYTLVYKVLNTSEYGNIPQNRERIYVIAFRDKADLDNFNLPEPIESTVGIRDLLSKEKQAEALYYHEDHPYYPKLTEAMTNRDTVYQWRRVYVRENKSNECPTLTANMGTGGHNVPLILDDYGIRKLTPEECLRFQGFPEWYRFPDAMANSHKYKQAGNSVSVPVIQRLANNIISAMHSTDNAERI